MCPQCYRYVPMLSMRLTQLFIYLKTNLPLKMTNTIPTDMHKKLYQLLYLNVSYVVKIKMHLDISNVTYKYTEIQKIVVLKINQQLEIDFYLIHSAHYPLQRYNKMNTHSYTDYHCRIRSFKCNRITSTFVCLFII